ncbi:MAG: hypothetical protein WBL11_06790 [Bacteroidales bacterium]|jgi:3-phosphoshikimate 1-carboxyvinyltransferase|nr:hypothetical protein [Bacteroidales bacterium]MDI9576370.1 hypothetical protein [Bacteroidota bacterium]MDD2593914.1 hypothetical protein [Bacteroidales bacterium]MDD3755052.1 hypothetical protein [Bacteroidales bacterium]MDY0400408.1 hypothetical protein [Bacteroidales bacterium]
MKISRKLLKNNLSISLLGSKSIVIRHLLISLFHNSKIILRNVQFCDDVVVAINLIKTYGKIVDIVDKNTIKISGQITKIPEKIYCGESASLLRMIVPIHHSFHNKCRYDGDKTLLVRDFIDIEEMLSSLGLSFSSTKLPFIVIGELNSQNNYSLMAKQSSQVVSGLLISTCFQNLVTTIHCPELVSAPYVYLTAEIINLYGGMITYNDKTFQVKPNNLQEKSNDFLIEGDWSLGAMILALGLTFESCTVKNLSSNSLQPDSEILSLFDNLSIKYQVTENSIITYKQNYNGFSYDITNTPDLVPALMILSANANSPSVITGIKRLTNKESNRANTLAENFIRLGGRLETTNENTWIIYPSQIHGGEIKTYEDHRVAMLGIFLGLLSEEDVEIDNWQCISKSYWIK